MFKMFATVFLILSISSLTQSAPQAPPSEIRGGKWWSLRTEENCGDTLFIEARDQQELTCTKKCASLRIQIPSHGAGSNILIK